MALLDDLKNKINNYFTEKYEVEETTIVPSTDYSKLTFGNKGLTAELTFLFVDIRKSSQLHDTYGHIDAAKIYQMSGGQFNCPIVFRGPTASAGQLGATHSQAFENWFANTPGLKVVVPSTPCSEF